MAGKPAELRQRDLKQAILAAQKAGAKQVEVKLSRGASIVIPLVPDDDKPIEADEPITL